MRREEKGKGDTERYSHLNAEFQRRARRDKTTFRMGENNSKWSNWQRTISKIYKQLLQLNSIKINDPIKKWAQELNRHFSKEDYRWLTNTWKDAQHHSLSEKCKSKPLWGTISHQSEWLRSKSLQSNKCWRGCGEKGTLLHCWWECKLVQPLWRTVWRFLKKLEIDLPYDPAIPLLGIHTEETRIERDVYPSVHHSTVYNSQDMEAT